MIEIQNLSKSYGAYDVLNDVSLKVAAGEFVVLLGPNGAGKSTLMSCLLGTTAYEGTVRVAGRDPLTDGCSMRRTIGYMPQAGNLHGDMSVFETLQFYADLRGVSEPLMPLLDAVKLSEHAEKLVDELSGGMKQRLSFAIAQLGRPSVLLLDEPSASLDRESREIMFARLRQLSAEGVTIILSTHLDHDLASCASRFVVLDNGGIVEERVGMEA